MKRRGNESQLKRLYTEGQLSGLDFHFAMTMARPMSNAARMNERAVEL